VIASIISPVLQLDRAVRAPTSHKLPSLVANPMMPPQSISQAHRSQEPWLRRDPRAGLGDANRTFAPTSLGRRLVLNRPVTMLDCLWYCQRKWSEFGGFMLMILEGARRYASDDRPGFGRRKPVTSLVDIFRLSKPSSAHQGPRTDG